MVCLFMFTNEYSKHSVIHNILTGFSNVTQLRLPVLFCRFKSNLHDLNLKNITDISKLNAMIYISVDDNSDNSVYHIG